VFLVDDFPEYCDGKSESSKALKGTPVTIRHYVENCDAAIKRAQDAGATVFMPAADMFWGDRYGVVTDPYGNKWAFATHIRDLTPDQMQTAMKGAFAQGQGRVSRARRGRAANQPPSDMIRRHPCAPRK
jgi:PhnB protein